ncbi:MAG TPA: terminase, partial [Burkholderiaceae bacterium]
DIVGFGGAAGGGKTDLACGLATTQHRKTGVFRLNGTELTGINDRLAELLGGRDAYSGRDNIWRFARHSDCAAVQVEMGSFPNPGDEAKYQGRPHDLLVFDEASNMREAAVRFLLGWLRTTVPGQRCRALMTFNPPTYAEGRWIVEFFAPWLDKKHPNPAKPGELRWFTTIDGKDKEVPSGAPFVHNGETIQPLSRTFIPSRVTDNPYLMGTGYMSMLSALPEPLRSQMLYGDFNAGITDNPWQVIPTAWVEAAQARWALPAKLEPMDSIGVDVARGGKDSTILAPRHGMWFAMPTALPGRDTPDGPTVAGQVVGARRDDAVVHIDVIGVGASPYDFLQELRVQAVGVNVSESPTALDKSGRLRFFNLRSQLWWQMREALDPAANTGIALPPVPQLLADLCAPTWSISGNTIKVASREEIIKAIGRSPDYGSAYTLALMDTPKRTALLAAGLKPQARREYDPYA